MACGSPVDQSFSQFLATAWPKLDQPKLAWQRLAWQRLTSLPEDHLKWLNGPPGRRMAWSTSQANVGFTK
jgi:hypothetical protein